MEKYWYSLVEEVVTYIDDEDDTRGVDKYRLLLVEDDIVGAVDDNLVLLFAPPE